MLSFLKREKKEEREDKGKHDTIELAFGFGIDRINKMFLPDGSSIIYRNIVSLDDCKVVYIDARGKLRRQVFCDGKKDDSGGVDINSNTTSNSGSGIEGIHI